MTPNGFVGRIASVGRFQRLDPPTRALPFAHACSCEYPARSQTTRCGRGDNRTAHSMLPEIQAPVLAVRICCASSVAALGRNENWHWSVLLSRGSTHPVGPQGPICSMFRSITFYPFLNHETNPELRTVTKSCGLRKALLGDHFPQLIRGETCHLKNFPAGQHRADASASIHGTLLKSRRLVSHASISEFTQPTQRGVR